MTREQENKKTREQEDERTRGREDKSTRRQDDEKTRRRENKEIVAFTLLTSYFLLPTSYFDMITVFHKRQTFEQVSSLRNLSKFYLIL